MKYVLCLLLVLFVYVVPVNATEHTSGCTVTENSIKIDRDLKKGDVLKVYNTLARLVKVHEVSKDCEEIKVCDLGLKAGDYFLSIKSNGLPWSAGKITVK